VPEFLTSPYKYYSKQRPIDIGTFPKTDGGPAYIVNFDMREYVENASFRAWGYITYNAPLSKEQIDIYELRAASDNPDRVKASPYQLEAQLQIIGECEKGKKMPEMKRLTWWHPDFGVFVKKSWVTHERVAERYNDIAAKKAIAIDKSAGKKLITDLGRQVFDGNSDSNNHIEAHIQVVGHWEEIKRLPEHERFTWHKPSIHAFALREPAVSPEQLEQRYNRAMRELTQGMEEKTALKPIAEQLAVAGKLVKRYVMPPNKREFLNHEER
jgi:hypothetical protein